jgi:uncharacterized OB-fold protein
MASDTTKTGQGKKSEGKCPECGEPIENLRVTCPNCAYEYKEEDYTDTDEGTEFTAGSNVDEEGNEIKELPEDREGAGTKLDSDKKEAKTSS